MAGGGLQAEVFLWSRRTNGGHQTAGRHWQRNSAQIRATRASSAAAGGGELLFCVGEVKEEEEERAKSDYVRTYYNSYGERRERETNLTGFRFS
jgi:hypothetical protein